MQDKDVIRPQRPFSSRGVSFCMSCLPSSGMP